MEVLFFILVLAVVVGLIASARERSGFGYFCLSLILSPLISFIIVVCLPNLKKQRIEREREADRRAEDQRRHEETIAALLKARE